jgi:predicted phage terminase large subunit-like protein
MPNTLPITAAELSAVEQELARRHLHDFVRQAWPIVEPDVDFVDNWHIEGLCAHLEAVVRGEISNLLINVPPGCCKSLLTSVFLPAWTWIEQPSARWLFASYGQELSTRDSLRCRSIVTSPWYRDRWGDRFTLMPDQNCKTRYDTDHRGWRIATSVGGRATGEHPDFIIVDDPHNAKQAESAVQRQAALNWWDGTISTRGRARGVRRVVIMQRLHERDLSGHLLESGEWQHICLPMEFEPDRMRPTTLNGWTDRRTEVGELLWPALFDRASVASLTRELGSARAAGQLQQRPPEHYEGAEWPNEYFGASRWFDDWPPEERIVLRVMALDPSKGGHEKSDYSAFVLLALEIGGRMWVDADIQRRDTDRIVRDAFAIGRDFRPDGFGIESNGFQSLLCAPIAERSKRAGFALPIFPIHNNSNKRERIRRLTPYLSRGELRFKRDSPGAELLVDMLREFPGHQYDDGPDALEMAVRLTRKLWSGDDEEVEDEIVSA